MSRRKIVDAGSKLAHRRQRSSYNFFPVHFHAAGQDDAVCVRTMGPPCVHDGIFAYMLAYFLLFSTLMLPGRALGQEIHATVLGEVARPGTYAVKEGDRLSSLLDRAGGFADNAWLRGAALSRESARVQRGPLLRDLISRIEREVFAKPGEQERKRKFIRQLSELKPGSRIPVRLTHLRLLKGSEDDLPLEDGDALLVPSRTNLVTVTGAVKTPGAVSLSSPKTDPEDYIRRAGGFTEDADRNHVYLLKADATVTSLSREWIHWNPEESRWEIPAFRKQGPRVEPGDTIVVPKRPGSKAWARDIKDLPQLLMQIHALTGVRVDPP